MTHILIPRTPSMNLLRPFIECPTSELDQAWAAMVRIAEVQHARAGSQCLAQIEEPAQPVLYVSPGQLANHSNPEGPESEKAGRYQPARVTPAGKFTQPLYAGEAPATVEPRARDLLGIVRTAQAEARRLINGEDSGSDLAQTKLDLPETLRVLEHALSQPAAVAGSALDVTLDEDQADLLRDMLGDPAEYEEALTVRLIVCDGHSGHGLYVAQAEYQDEGAALLAPLPAPAAPTAPQDWRIDTSAGREILVYKNCSVIEDADARYVLALIAAASQPAAVAGPARDWPDTCDGKEQEAFEAWAQRERHNMEQHPLHYLFLDAETNAARQGWKAGLLYAVEQMKTQAAPALEAPAAPAGFDAWWERAGDGRSKLMAKQAWDAALAAAPQAPAALDELRQIAAIAACWGCDHPDEPGDTETVRRVKWAARQLRAVAQAPAAPVGLPWCTGIPPWTDDRSVRVIAVTAHDDFGGVQVHDIRASDFHTDGDGDGAEVARVCTHWAYRDDIWPRANAVAPAAPIPWDNFPAYLIDHCEGQTITEDSLQRALSAMLANPQYAGAAPAAPAVDADPLGLRDVGEALMETIERNADALKAVGWTGPMYCPSEIVVDLLNLLEEANTTSALGEWVATLEVDSEGGLDYETVPPCTLPPGCYPLYRAAQAKEGGAA